MTRHKAHYLHMSGGVVSVGCVCGWRCDHPLRTPRTDLTRARVAWEQHVADTATAELGRLMRRAPDPRERPHA